MLTKHTNNSEYVFFEAWMCVVYALHSLFVPYLLRKTNKLVRTSVNTIVIVQLCSAWWWKL